MPAISSCFTSGVMCWHDVQVLLGPKDPQQNNGGNSTTCYTRRGGYAQPTFEAGEGPFAWAAQHKKRAGGRKHALITTVHAGSCVWASASLGGVLPPVREKSPTKRPREIVCRGCSPEGRDGDAPLKYTRGLKPAGGTETRFVLRQGPGRTGRTRVLHLEGGPMFQRSEHGENLGGSLLESVNLGRHLGFFCPEGVRETLAGNNTARIDSRSYDLSLVGWVRPHAQRHLCRRTAAEEAGARQRPQDAPCRHVEPRLAAGTRACLRGPCRSEGMVLGELVWGCPTCWGSFAPGAWARGAGISRLEVGKHHGLLPRRGGARLGRRRFGVDRA
jgi:hypothetical protein